DLLLLSVPRRNQTPRPSAAYCHLHAHLRPVIEVVNSQLALQFPIETNHAHTFWGLTARLYTKLATHTLCVWLNRLLGVPDLLRLNCLAFPNKQHNSLLSSTTPCLIVGLTTMLTNCCVSLHVGSGKRL